MDESKKGKKVVEEAARFIKNGEWTGGKIKLGTKERQEIIEHFLYFVRAWDVFPHLSKFFPIEHLINNDGKNLQEVRPLITDIGSVNFSGDINIKTCCREMIRLSIRDIKRSETQKYEEEDILLITRQMEWITWHLEKDVTYEAKSYKVISKASSFKVISDISQFLKSDIDVYSILDRIYLWLHSDIENRKKQLETKNKALLLAETMRDRMGKIIR